MEEADLPREDKVRVFMRPTWLRKISLKKKQMLLAKKS